ncbi:hypothetical protein DTO021D3_8368 [Paecilomyces variotii]|nr:hypothetical protein DTO032I3_6893 [Paecilomyces variotii]KAJ9274784.1 hypothetical protein DTO021D3_8368 [Paecilomyces variotii]KAJ9306674.1 hypothetical protein DTO217A2_3842 [Paecilomyces variotii]KAJ9341298.1 hypothetical protein DTO027B6_6139 [Paecilomyces variotii]KAJ9378779.1 hypothetical protein DTO032I4_7533 [Paecilomyces variotii]
MVVLLSLKGSTHLAVSPRQDNDTPPPNGCPSFIHCNSLVVVVGGLQSLHSASPPQTNLGIRAGETADTLPLLSRLPYLLSCLSPFRLRSPRSFPLSPTTLLVRVCGLFVSQASSVACFQSASLLSTPSFDRRAFPLPRFP